MTLMNHKTINCIFDNKIINVQYSLLIQTFAYNVTNITH